MDTGAGGGLPSYLFFPLKFGGESGGGDATGMGGREMDEGRLHVSSTFSVSATSTSAAAVGTAMTTPSSHPTAPTTGEASPGETRTPPLAPTPTTEHEKKEEEERRRYPPHSSFASSSFSSPRPPGTLEELMVHRVEKVMDAEGNLPAPLRVFEFCLRRTCRAGAGKGIQHAARRCSFRCATTHRPSESSRHTRSSHPRGKHSLPSSSPSTSSTDHAAWRTLLPAHSSPSRPPPSHRKAEKKTKSSSPSTGGRENPTMREKEPLPHTGKQWEEYLFSTARGSAFSPALFSASRLTGGVPLHTQAASLSMEVEQEEAYEAEKVALRARRLGVRLLHLLLRALPFANDVSEHACATWLFLVLSACKYDILSCLLTNLFLSDSFSLFQSSVQILGKLLCACHYPLGRELQTLLAVFLLPLMASPCSHFRQKLAVLSMIREVFQQRNVVISFFLNYDCNPTLDPSGEYRGMLEMLVAFVMEILFADQRLDPLPLFSSSMREEENKGEEEGGGAPHEKGGKELGKHGGNGVVRRRTSSPSSFSSSSSDSDTSSTSSCASSSSFSGRDGTGMLWGGPEAGSPKRTSITMTSPLCGAAASSLTPVFLLSSPSHFFSLDTILPHLALSHRSIPASVTPWREAHAMPSTTTSYYDRKKARTSSRHEKRRDEAPDDEEETHRKTGLVGEVGSPLRIRAFRSTAGGGKHRAGGGGGEVSWVLETESDGKLNKKKRDEEGEDRKEISATLREGTGETGAASPRGYLTLDQQRQLRREGVLAFQSLITSLYTWVTEDPKEMATAVLQHSSPTTTARELPRYGTRTANESWDGMAHAFSAASLPEVSAPFFSSKAGPPLSLWPWCYCKDRAGTRVLTGLRGSPWLQQQLELPSYEGSSSSSSLSSSSSSVQSSFSSSSVVEAEEQATPQRTKWRRRSAPLPGSVERSERSPMTTLHTSITTTTEERKRSPRNVSEPSRGTSNLTREPSGTPFLSTTPHDVDDHHHDAHDTHRTPLLPTLKRRRSETRSRPTTGGVTSTSRDGWQESVCLMTPPPSLSLGTWEEDAPPMLRSPLPRPPLPPTGATSQVASPFLPTGSPLSALFLLPPPPPPSSPSFTRSPPDSRKRRDPPPSPSSFTSPFLFSTPWPSTCSCNNYHQYLRYLCGQKIAEESRRYTQKGSHMGMDVEEEKEMEETTGTRNTHSAPHPTNTRRPPSHPLPEAEMAPPEVGDPYRWERVRYLAEGGPATNPPRRSICHARQAMDRERSTNTSSSSSSSSQRGSGHTSPGSGSLHSSGSRSEVEEEKSDRLRLAARYTIRREWRRSINPVWFLMLPSQAHASRWLARRYHHLGEGGMDTPEEMAHASSPPGPTTGGDENDAPMRLPEAMPQSGIEEEEDAEAEEAYYWYWCGEEERTWERAHGMTPFLSSSFSFSPGAAAELSPLHPTSPSPMTGSPVGPSPPPFLIRYHWKHIHHLRQNHLLAVEACRMIDDGRWKEAKQFLETHEYLPRISPSADELQGLSLPPGKSSYAPFARFLFEHPNIRREAMEGIFDRVNKRQDNGPKYIAGEFFHLLPYRGVPIDIAFCDTICRFVSWERPMFESDTWGVLQSVFGEAYAIQNKDDPDWHLSASDAGTMGGVLLFLHSMLHNKNVGSEGQLGEGDFVASALDCLDTPLKEETMREIYARVAKKKWELDGYGRTPCQAAWETQACNEPLTTRVWRQRSEGLRRALLRCERWKEMEAMWLKNAYEEVIGVRLAEAERRKRKQKKRQRRQRRKEERRKEKQRRQKAAGKQEETTPHTKDEGEAAASADEEKKREGQEIPFSPYTFSNSFFLSPDFFKDHWGDSPRVGSVEKMSFAPPHRRQSFPFTTDDQTMRPTETTREKHERQEGTRRGTHSQRGIQGSMPREYPGGGESFSVASCPSSVGVSSLSRSRKGKPHKPRNPKLKKDERTGSWKMVSLSFSSVSSSSMSTEWKRMNASSALPSFSFFLLFVLRAVHECHEWYYTNALAYLKRKLQEAEEKQRPHVPTTEQDGEAERETAGASGCERPDTRKTGTHSMASAGPQKRKDPSVVSSGQAYSSPSSSAVPSSRHSQDEEAMEHTHTPLRLSTLQPTFPRYVEELTRVPAVRAALGVKEQNGGSGGVAGREVEDRGGSAGAGGSTTTTSSRKGTGKVLSRLQLSKRLSTTMLASTLPSGVITGSSTSLEKKSHRTTTAKRTRYTSPLPFIGAVLSAPTNATASASFSSAAVSTASFFHQWYKKADPALKKLEQLHQLFFFSRFAFTPQPYVLPHYAEHVRPILQLIMPSILAGLYWVLRETDEVPMHYLVTDLHQQLGELASFFLLQMDGLEQAVEETLKKYLLGPHSGRLVPPYRATFALHQYFL